jgi:hypothetical protein
LEGSNRARAFGAPDGTGRNCAEDTIEIAACDAAVWDLLADFDGWESWNPLYVETSGSLRVGETITFAVALEGMKPRQGSATVLTVEPNTHIRYVTVAFAGLVRATRYIEIRPSGPQRCTVVNGEHMGGLLGPLLYRAVGEKVRIGLKGMNEALRTLAESRA